MTSTTCPSCGAPASGKFCANCGAGLAGATCANCAAPLTPGAKFCHRCGTPAGAAGLAGVAGNRGVAAVLPWAVAAIALLSLVAMLAGNRFGANRGGASQAAAPAAPAAPAGPFAGGNAAGNAGATGGAPAPDISQLSPEERADRLFDRVMRLDEEGKKDSVLFFAPMAMASYQMLGPLDADRRFHLGSIALAVGDTESLAIARAQADSILQGSRDHLLGLILLQYTATQQNDAAAAREARTRLLAAERTELAKNLDEYIRHRPYIDAALAAARRSR